MRSEVLLVCLSAVVGAMLALAVVRYVPSASAFVVGKPESVISSELQGTTPGGAILGLVVTKPDDKVKEIVLRANRLIQAIALGPFCARRDDIKAFLDLALSTAQTVGPGLPSCADLKEDAVVKFRKALSGHGHPLVTDSSIEDTVVAYEAFLDACTRDMCGEDGRVDATKVVSLCKAAIDSVCP